MNTNVPQPITWKLDKLTVLDVLEILHWQYETDIATGLSRLFIIAGTCTDEPLKIRNLAATLHDFVEAVNKHIVALEIEKIERAKDAPP